MTPKQLKSLEDTLSLLRKHARLMRKDGARGISMSLGEISLDVAWGPEEEKAEASGGIGFMLDPPAEEYDDED